MAETWYVGRNGIRTGPFTSSQIRELAATGGLNAGDMLWKEGMASWVQASTVKGLFSVQAASVPPRNPYAAPAIGDLQLDTGVSGEPADYAEFLPRAGAALLDALFLGLMGCIPFFGILVAFLALAGNDPEARQIAPLFANCCAQVVSMMIGATYYVVLETSAKQGTWGKQIVGIKVTDLQGNRITTGRAIGRYLARFVTGLTCGIGLLMPLFTEKKQTLHDMIAGCLALDR